MKKIWKKTSLALGIIALFLALSYGFVPQVLSGKIVNQSDISGYVGMSHEMSTWNKAHPDNPTYWTDAMFGGMPTTAISTQNVGDYTEPLYKLLFAGKRPAPWLFVGLLGAFLLLLALGVSWPVALCGAMAVAFCSYNFQIIQVGHNTKMQAIALMPWVLAALVYTYRFAAAGVSEPGMRPRATSGLTGNFAPLLGAALFGLTLSFQIKANHQQISYYLALMVLIYALVELVHTIRTKAWKAFLLASALLLVLGGAGIATNVNKLLPLAKYTPNTMRGGSVLSREGANAKGLDLDYATAWSYGWEELPNLMIPNFNGGSSAGKVNPDKSATIRLLKRAGQKNLKETARNLPMYWGPQPFTAGPMYMGAVTFFLFVLGLFLYRGRNKWWLTAASLLAVLLAVGNHFMPFTAFCFNYLPLYNKFRTVSMALVVLQVTLPALGFLTLDGMLKGQYDKSAFRKALAWAFGLTGGFCLLSWLAPGLFGNFEAASDAGMQEALADALVTDRRALFRADALRSFLLISAPAALLLWAFRPKGQTEDARTFAGAGRRRIVVPLMGLLVLLDMFAAGKRYLNADHFTTPRAFDKTFVARPADEMIKADTDPQYRVLDLTVNVFNSSVPSYHHKNVGGYSPAKLQRYQDLIEQYLSGEINGLYRQLGASSDLDEVAAWMERNTPVLNALNTRYLVLDGDYPPLRNPAAFGPAWFVDSVVEAASPDEEMALLGQVDLRRQAVLARDAAVVLNGSSGVAKDGTSVVANGSSGVAENGTSVVANGSSGVRGGAKGLSHSADYIEMTSYAPNELHYRYSAARDRLAVFSEIYYPNGWHATIDGQPLRLLRADWTFRAALLPAGEHEVVMTFLPDSYRQGARVSRIASIGLLLILLAALVLTFLPIRLTAIQRLPKCDS